MLSTASTIESDLTKIQRREGRKTKKTGGAEGGRVENEKGKEEGRKEGHGIQASVQPRHSAARVA